jgi:hypothetical protein
MRRLTLAAILSLAFVVSGCPDRKEIIEEVGGAPKRQIDHAQERVDTATKNIEDRLNRAADTADE